MNDWYYFDISVVYLFEDFELYKKAQEGKNVFVFVFPATIIQLEVQDFGQVGGIFLEYPQEDRDCEVGIVGEFVQINERMLATTMDYTPGDMRWQFPSSIR